MPEAAMHKNDLAESGKNHIGLAGQIGNVQSVAEAHSMHEAADCNLQRGVLAPHPGHPFASLVLREVVHCPVSYPFRNDFRIKGYRGRNLLLSIRFGVAKFNSRLCRGRRCLCR